MKHAIAFIVAGALALAVGFPLAATGLFMLTVVVLVNQLPETGCNRNCREGRKCNCGPQSPGRNGGAA